VAAALRFRPPRLDSSVPFLLAPVQHPPPLPPPLPSTSSPLRIFIGPSTPPQAPERTPLFGLLPPRRTARSATRHPAQPASPPRHHHPLARTTRTAPASPRHRPTHSTTRVDESRHSRLFASVTARHCHTTFHASRLSPILALSCGFNSFKNKNTVWRISEQVPPITPSTPHPTRSYAARILVSSSSEAQTPRFKPPEREKHPSFTWLDLTNAIPTAMLSRHMQRYVTE